MGFAMAPWSVLHLVALCCYAQAINIWPGVAPGSENWIYRERTEKNTPIGTVVFNVTTPTLTPYLPESSTATGAGVIIAPGGAFVALAMDVEANEVARWLQARGIAAFVLKYRIAEKKQEGMPTDLDVDAVARYGIADAVRALEVVRQRAAEWRVSPDKVGILGFSAGAMVASGALLNSDPARRPNFAGLIYGAPFAAMPTVPAGLPPVFMAWAQDDSLAGPAVARFYEALRASGYKPEAHIFSKGGHGFGMKKQGTTSDRWIDEFSYWLEAQGLMRPAGQIGLR